MSAIDPYTDEGLPIVEGDECQFCASPTILIDRVIYVEGVYQVIEHGGAPMFLCERCWWKARHGADSVNVSNDGGVHTIYAPAAS